MKGKKRMRALLSCSVLLLLSLILSAQEDKPVALHCGKIYIGNGQVMTNVYMVVEKGKVLRLSRTRPEDTQVVDASDKVVMPGIVAADSDFAGNGDNEYNVNPDFVALSGFDFLGEYKRALSGGVTTAYLSPGRKRLVAGQGSVVKLYGEDMVRRVLKERACLRITLGQEATTAPKVFEPTPHPTSDDPLLPARAQYPSSRLSQLTELRRIFHASQTGKGGDETRAAASSENIYAAGPLEAAISGQLPLRIAAKEAPDILGAIHFAESLGCKMVLENPYEVEKVISVQGGKPFAAVFRLPVRLGRGNEGGEDRLDDSVRNRPENPALAAKAGATIALVPATDDDLKDCLLMAGLAIRMGLSEKQALEAITLGAAKLLGVDDRVGSLEPGKDADFLLLSGEPFAIGTMVEDTFVDGRQAYHRETENRLLAVRARRIITLEGSAVDNGVIIVQGRKIKAIGQDLTVPYGATVIDLGDAVIVPGFVDAFCHLGLSGEGQGIPTGTAAQRLTDVVQYDDRLLEEAAQAGLTTVLIAGRDSGLVSGRVAAIKTAAADKESMVLRDIAGIRFVHDNIAKDSIKSLEAAIDKGKKYLETWQKYEKDLADFKAGKKKPDEKPKEEKEEKKEEKTPKSDPISGKWKVEPEGLRFPIIFYLDLKLEGTKITGSMQTVVQGRTTGQEAPINEGKYENGSFRLVFGSGRRGSITFEGRVEGDRLVGNVSMAGGRMSGSFTATRTSGPPAPTAGGPGLARGKKSADGSPQKPPVDESLEPIKALLEKRIPAIINTTRAPAIKEIVALFEKNKLPYVLQGARDAVDTPEILGSSRPGILLTPNFIRKKGKKILNAAAMVSDHGLPVGLVSADTEGSRYLPLHAALAIRYGMDPNEALKALTLYPARMFKLEDEIGSLKRGKDADFVAFTGNPFEMTSQVKLVVVNGRIVVDNRKATGAGR